MENNMMRQELMEAIRAGEQALSDLKDARESLNSAKNWGLFDLFGGGFLADAVKHTKMNRANQHIERAKYNLEIFQRELKDVYLNTNIGINIGDFLSFADFFFDGLVADYMVQSRIADARAQVDLAIENVEGILKQLRVKYGSF